ncbi:hypothetical protein ACMUMQ_10700 [Marinomonas sp. 2405UD66-6]|uniref:hypothetical protein n=1 Tax=Marinomonas sp. 2405UD66-6 TaxID=3391834 RepID=UPI0039C9810F
MDNVEFFLKILLFLFGIPLGIRVYLLSDKYGLEIFDDIDETTKKYIVTDREKIMVVGLLKPLKLIRKRNPVTFYLFYIISGILCVYGFVKLILIN